MNDFTEIGRMTPREYRIRMTAFKLKRLDEEYLVHLQAFKNQQVQATKNNGKKPYFKDFNDFFPYKKNENEILSKKPEPKKTRKNKKMMEMLMKANS